MLRRILVNDQKIAPAIFTAGAALKRGMLVKLDENTGKVAAASDPVSGVYFVDKETIQEGINSKDIVGEMSEYDDIFENIASGELVVLEAPIPGETYATDQFSLTSESTAVAGTTALSVSDGKFVEAGKSATTIFRYAGIYNDGSKKLYKVRVEYPFTTPAT